MQVGKLRHKISIEERTDSLDGRGESVEIWSKYLSAKAGIYSIDGDETEKMHQENNSVTHRVIMRYRAGVTAKMRVNFNGRLFDIESVINVNERNKSLKLMCEERL